MRRVDGFILAVSLLLVAGLVFSEDKDDEAKEVELESRVGSLDSVGLARQQEIFAAIDSGFTIIRSIMERSCFDCHSQNTRFPWYAKLPGVKQYLNGHITEGREELDMTNGFPFGGKGDQIKKLRKMREEIAEGKMPLWSYRIMHWGTAIEDERRDSVFSWIDASIARLEAAGR